MLYFTFNVKLTNTPASFSRSLTFLRSIFLDVAAAFGYIGTFEASWVFSQVAMFNAMPLPRQRVEKSATCASVGRHPPPVWRPVLPAAAAPDARPCHYVRHCHHGRPGSPGDGKVEMPRAMFRNSTRPKCNSARQIRHFLMFCHKMCTCILHIDINL